jgi:hypothetical protein
VAGLLAHGVYDVVHDALVHGHGGPQSWPAFCATFDGVLALLVAWRARAGMDPEQY